MGFRKIREGTYTIANTMLPVQSIDMINGLSEKESINFIRKVVFEPHRQYLAFSDIKITINNVVHDLNSLFNSNNIILSEPILVEGSQNRYIVSILSEKDMVICEGEGFNNHFLDSIKILYRGIWIEGEGYVGTIDVAKQACSMLYTIYKGEIRPNDMAPGTENGSPQSTTQPDVGYCPKCGHKVTNRDDNFCKYCGKQLRNSEEQHEEE